MTDIVGYAQFVATKAGKTGLTPTVDVFRITRSTGASSQIVTGQNATEVGRGGYSYQVTGADLSLYDYLFAFITADATVDQQQILALWTNYGVAYATEMGRIDVAVSTRLAGASYTSPPSVASIADGVWDEVLTGATHNVPSSAGRRLRQIASSIIIDGFAVTATTNTITLDASASSTNGAYDPALIYIVSGKGAGQSRLIYQYVGATKVATVDRDWKEIPDATSEYVIAGDAGREHVNEGTPQGATNNTITLNPQASPDDGAYINQTVFVRSGTGADQVRRVIAYDGITKVATVDHDWYVNPDTASGYVMIPNLVLPTYTFPAGAITYTYTVTDSVTALPIEGVDVWFATDNAFANIVWRGITDVFGVARDVNNDKPKLDAGTYYIRLQKTGYSFSDDTEIVS